MQSVTIIGKLLKLLEGQKEIVITFEEFQFLVESAEAFGKKEVLELLLEEDFVDVKIVTIALLREEHFKIMNLLADFSLKTYFKNYRKDTEE